MIGAILAGGRARRLGGLPKGFVEVAGRPLIHRLLDVVAALGLDPVILGAPGGPYARLGVPVLPDLIPDRGPPGGLHAALAAAPPGWLCLLALDLPYIDAPTLLDLRARCAGQHAVLAEAGGRLQPLAGWWHTRTLAPLTALLEHEEPGFRRITSGLEVTVVPVIDPRPFTNLNTPAEVASVGGRLPEKR